ncbi:hypothetical protein ElyMa_000679500 [Elysia marginata]|uniref:Uncharacterized protein n=1 Tax=Elysia marginata TaxID=1093978 RepID=A0AAV4GGY8_9GAST|nr:hypothetical protein ElyMa_000679500 [Elysia marginata]
MSDFKSEKDMSSMPPQHGKTQHEERKILDQLQKQQDRQHLLLKKLFQLRKTATLEKDKLQYGDEQETQQGDETKLTGEHCQDELQPGDHTNKSPLLHENKVQEDHSQETTVPKKQQTENYPEVNIKEFQNKYIRSCKQEKAQKIQNKIAALTAEKEELLQDFSEMAMLSHSSPKSHPKYKHYKKQKKMFSVRERSISPRVYRKQHEYQESENLSKANRKRQSSRHRRVVGKPSKDGDELRPELTSSLSMTDIDFYQSYTERRPRHLSPNGQRMSLQSKHSDHSLQKKCKDLSKISTEVNVLNQDCVPNSSHLKFQSAPGEMESAKEYQKEIRNQETLRNQGLLYLSQPPESPEKISKQQTTNSEQSRKCQRGPPEDNQLLPQHELEIEPRPHSDSELPSLKSFHNEERRGRLPQVGQLQQEKEHHEQDQHCIGNTYRTQPLAMAQDSSEQTLKSKPPKSPSNSCESDQHRRCLTQEGRESPETDKEEEPEVLPVGYAWYPPVDPVKQPVLEPECVRTGITLAQQQRSSAGESLSPLALPLKNTQRSTKPAIKETPSNETIKSESFKTVPLRIKSSPLRSKCCVKRGKKQSDINDGSLQDKQRYVQKAPPGVGLWLETRLPQTCSKDTRRDSTERKRPAVSQSPSPRRRVPLKDRPPCPSKPGAAAQTRSPSRDKDAYDRSPRTTRFLPRTFGTKSNKRSLSAGIVESGEHAGFISRKTLLHNSLVTRSKPWKENPPATSKLNWGLQTKTSHVSREEQKSSMTNPTSFSIQIKGGKLGEGPDNKHQSPKSVNSSKREGIVTSSPRGFSRGWKPPFLDQLISVNEPVMTLSNGVHAKSPPSSFELGYMWNLEPSGHLTKRLGFNDEFCSTTEFLNVFQGGSSIEKPEDALLRLYHLPCSLRSLKRGGMSVFESMSVPAVCINRHAILANLEPQVNIFTVPTELQSCISELQKDNTTNRAPRSEAHRGSLKLKTVAAAKDGLWNSGKSSHKPEKTTITGRPSVTASQQKKCLKLTQPRSKLVKPDRDLFRSENTKVETLVAPPKALSASPESWIKRRESSLHKLSILSNPALDALTKPMGFSNQNEVECPETFENRGTEDGDGLADDNSASLSLAETPRLARRDSIVLSLTPRKERNAEPNAFSSSFSQIKQQHIANSSTLSMYNGGQSVLAERRLYSRLRRFVLRVFIMLILGLLISSMYLYNVFGWDFLEIISQLRFKDMKLKLKLDFIDIIEKLDFNETLLS